MIDDKRKALVISLGSRSTAENYGAILQMTAFCKILQRRYGIEPTVLDYTGINCSKCTSPVVVLDFIFGNTFKEKVRRLFLGRSIVRRFNSNLEFIASQVEMTASYNYSNIDTAVFDFDYYIAESDVIWDPTFRNSGFDKTFFLDCKSFLQGKKVVYGAGLGDAVFSKKDKNIFKEFIKKIDYYSVRELYASQYIESFMKDTKVKFVLDPTLLIESNYFTGLVRNRIVKEKYVLVYSPAFDNEKMIEDAYKYARLNNLRVIIIKRCISRKHIVDTRIDISVDEFLNYLMYSDMFFCDSFHGVCLSVQLKKQFYVYERDDGRKISDICKRLDLEDRIVSEKLIGDSIAYDQVYKRLSQEKRDSFAFLDCVFNV